MPSENTEQRKLAAIIPLCGTDMVGYSALSQRNESLALELLEEHRCVLRGLFPKHQGTEIKTSGSGLRGGSPRSGRKNLVTMARGEMLTVKCR